MSVQLEAIGELLLRFRELLGAGQGPSAQALAEFLSSYRQMITTSTRSRHPFNVLDVIGVGADEVQHSSIIAWLLAPYESHGCGTLFLEQFLLAAGIEFPEGDLSRCRVRTEFAGHEAIIDILVYAPNAFVVYVENKTFAAEQPRQVDREYRDMMLLADVVRVPPERAFAVFLTPTGRPPVSGDPTRWRTISYRQLARHFEGLRSRIDGKVGFFIEDLIGQYDRWSGA